MAAEEQLLIFKGASAGRYPQRSRPSEQRHKNRQLASAHGVAEITGRGAVLAWHLQPAAGMLVPSRLARGPFFPQRPLCDLISASLGVGLGFDALAPASSAPIMETGLRCSVVYPGRPHGPVFGDGRCCHPSGYLQIDATCRPASSGALLGLPTVVYCAPSQELG